MTAARPLSPNARSTPSRQLANEQVPPHGAPAAPARTPGELVAALEDLYRESREFSETFEPILQRYVEYVQHDAEINGDDNDVVIHIPDEIAAPYDEAAPVIAQFLRAHAALVAQWDAAGMPDELPAHGLPAGSHLAAQFGAQRPEPPAAHRARLEGRFDALHDRAGSLMERSQRLGERVGPGDPDDELIDALLDLEGSYTTLFHERFALLLEWDRAGFGQAVPPHGLEPVATFHFNNFEALDQQRLAAIRAHAER